MAMLQRPSALGLTRCRLVLVEAQSQNVTLASTFNRLKFKEFPAQPDPFDVYSVLTDGLGEFDVSLVVARCDTLEEIYVRTHRVSATNPRDKQRLWWHVRSCIFPEPGDYEFSLQ